MLKSVFQSNLRIITIRKLTRGKRRMEGIQLDKSRKSNAESPVKSPKRTNFVGISPLKDLTNIETPKDRPFRVSIEGNIGAGKSTLIKYFENCQGIETYPEPIEWWRNLNGNNLLDLMYSDKHKWLKVFQSYVQLTRLKTQLEKAKSPLTTVQMYERSIQNNRFCFVECAYLSGFLHGGDYAVLDQWYRWIHSNCDIKLDLIVYLRSSPQIVYERMRARGRPEEASVSLEYLQQLHNSHEKWLMSDDERFNTVPVLVLDANKTLDDIFEQYKRNESKILGKEEVKQMDWDKDKIKRVLDMDK